MHIQNYDNRDTFWKRLVCRFCHTHVSYRSSYDGAQIDLCAEGCYHFCNKITRGF